MRRRHHESDVAVLVNNKVTQNAMHPGDGDGDLNLLGSDRSPWSDNFRLSVHTVIFIRTVI